MSYFDDASLVMIPSGYKDQKVYSVKPIDGSGDLTFTRSNDTASRIGPDGLIEKVRTNLNTYSQNFSATGGWAALFGATITPTANYGTAPDGTTTSTRIVFTGASQIYSKTISGLTGNIGVFSLWIKGTAGETIAITYGGASDKLVTLGSGWTRFNTDGNSASNDTIYINTFLSATALDIEVWAGQTELGDIATDYIATTTAAVSVGPVANLPRLDYSGGASCPRLLLEPQRTNLLQYSEQFDNAYWSKDGTTITANNTTSPDGYINADRLTSSGAGGDEYIQKTGLSTTAGTYTSSIFVKNVNATQTVLMAVHLGEGSVTSDMRYTWSTGAVTTNGTNAVSGKATSYGNGWVRLEFTYTIGASVSGHFFRTYVQIGVSTNSIFIYGAQFEAGDYATSYIPTLGAAVTRGADSASKTGIGSLLSASEYTLYWEGTHIPTGQYNSFMTIYKASDLNSSARFYRNNTNNEIRAAIFDSVSGLSLDLGSGVTTQTAKCALRVKAGDYALYVNGNLVNSSTSALAPSST
jgi:hypothetical protein